VALTVGVEEEFLVADLHGGALSPRADEVVEASHRAGCDDITTELNLCQIETATPICSNLDEVERELTRLRSGLLAYSMPLGLVPLPVGTHPNSHWQDQRIDVSSERYALMEERYQVVAREQVICGCHVHVALPDPELRIAIINRVRPWLATLLAMSANSPYWQNADTGYASYRTQIWQRWPTAGMPPELAGSAGFDSLVAEMVGAGAIDDATHLYWYVRPSARFPTIEFRVCDVCLDVADTVTLTGLLRGLVSTTMEEERQGAVPLLGGPAADSLLRAAVWRAARYGLDDLLFDPAAGRLAPAIDVVAALVAHIRPALDELGDWDRVAAGVERLIRQGNGASWQRGVEARGGHDQVVLELVERASSAAPGAPPGS
jgi:carboxylate-amine ligase